MLALSPRLQAALDFCQSLHTPGCGVLADIGTDHAYLPIAAVKHKICNTAIACDLHPGPLDIAVENIRRMGLGGKVETRLGDGLAPLMPGECDYIVIAGMGGMRIWSILLEGMKQAQSAKRLILQPQHDTVLLRKNLHKAGFEICGEKLVREVVGGKEHFYVVLAANYAGEVAAWSEREYFLGKFLIDEAGKDFFAYLKCEREKIITYISSIRDKTALFDATKRLEWLSIEDGTGNNLFHCQR